MNLHNHTLGQLERLHLLGCDVTITGGQPQASATSLAVAKANSAAHWLRVRGLRVYWKRMRNLDRLLERRRSAFWESYLIIKYVCRQELPSRWFRRV